MEQKRSSWTGSIGFILAAAGSAVGLGNIWKFPGKAYENGGGAWILIYIAIVALVGVSVMLTEFVLGRATQRNAVGAFGATNPRWKFIGGLGILTGFIILSYYGVVGGWTIKYIFSYLFDAASIYAAPQEYFVGFLSSPVAGLIWQFIFMAVTAVIIIAGVQNGIERVSKVLMPVLFILLIVMAVRAMTLPGAQDGISHMLSVDFSKINAAGVMAALGQAFFSLSLGMGVMCTYGSYLKKEENLVRNTFTICGLDTAVALLAGFTIIPAVFASGIEPGAGGSFAFVSLAAVFQNMPAGTFFGFLFYVLLFLAALTSSISLLEGTVAYLTEEKHFERGKCTAVSVIIMYAIGIFYALSAGGAVPLKGIWMDAAGISFPSLDGFMENLTDKLLMPIGGLLYCIFVGWIWGENKSKDEIEQNGTYRFILYPLWKVMIRYICPLAILLIFLGEFNVIRF